jgi:hypothetical protein
MKNENNQPLTYNEFYNFYKVMLSNNSLKEKCYGTDKSKWPQSACNKYNNDSTNIDADCLSELYSAKCPNFDKNRLHPSYVEKSKDYTLETIQGNIMGLLHPSACNLLYEPIPN